MREFWGLRSTLLLPSIPGPPDSVLSMGWIEQKSILMFNWIVWNRTIYIYIYIYIYVYIGIHRQTVLLYHNSSGWLDTLYAWSWDRNPPNFSLDLVSDRSANKRTTSAKGIIRYYLATPAAVFICLHFISCLK